MATEIDFGRRAARRLKLERIRNETIREIMEVQNTLVGDISSRQLVCSKKAGGKIAKEGH